VRKPVWSDADRFHGYKRLVFEQRDVEADKVIAHNTKTAFGHQFIRGLELFLNGVIMLIMMGSLGCKSQSSERNVESKPLLAIWNSKSASAKDRADAANKWIPAGTDGEMVRNLLGAPKGGWDHFHGPSFNADGKLIGAVDIWRLIYPYSTNLSVALVFNPVPNSSDFRVLFDHAFVYEAPETLTTSHRTSN